MVMAMILMTKRMMNGCLEQLLFIYVYLLSAENTVSSACYGALSPAHFLVLALISEPLFSLHGLDLVKAGQSRF